MTFILGMRCDDGLVLISDRRLTTEEGDISYGDKLFGDFQGLVYGFSGSESHFHGFREALKNAIASKVNKDGYLLTEDLNAAIRATRRTITKQFGKQVADRSEITVALRDSKGTKLYYSGNSKTFGPVPRYSVLGGGQERVWAYLAPLWSRRNGNPTMQDAAKIGYFCITLFSRLDVNAAIGLAKKGEHAFPDLWFIPNDRRQPIDRANHELRDYLHKWANEKVDVAEAFLDDFFQDKQTPK